MSASGKEDIYSASETDCWQAKQRRRTRWCFYKGKTGNYQETKVKDFVNVTLWHVANRNLVGCAGPPVIRSTEGQTCWLTGPLADLKTDSLSGWLTDWLTGLVDWLYASKQSFPTCSPPRHISAGERYHVPFTVFTVWSPAVGVQCCFISTPGLKRLFYGRHQSATETFSLPLPPLLFLALLRPQTCWMRPFWKS